MSIFGGFLKYNTSVKVPIGPFVDATDGFTPETGVTLAAADSAEIIKEDASAVTDISARTWSAIAGANGMYNLTLDTSDTTTLGRLSVYVRDDSICRPVLCDFMVLPANVYDSLVGGTDQLQIDVNQIDGNAASGFINGTTEIRADVRKVSNSSTAADNLEASALGIETGTAGNAATTTSIPTNLTETTDDHYNGRIIVFTSGVLANQAASISDYDGGSNTLTVSALTEAPSNGDTFVIV